MFGLRATAASPLWNAQLAWVSKYVSNAPPRMLFMGVSTTNGAVVLSAGGKSSAVHSQTFPIN